MTQVWIHGAALLSPLGTEWRGLLSADLPAGRFISRESLNSILALEPRQKRMMSFPAQLACVAFRKLIQELQWQEYHEDMGCFFGVGASDSTMPEIASIVDASTGVDSNARSWSDSKFGTAGLSVCHPLIAFQLMNNFTMSHASIQEQLSGPNSAFFSRGMGTHAAMREGIAALREGTCNRTLVGAADTALHPVTLSELKRWDYLQQGLIPSECAGVFGLSTNSGGALAQVISCRSWGSIHALESEFRPEPEVDQLVLAAWGTPARDSILSKLDERALGHIPVFDASPLLGESLAATAVSAWAVALDFIVQRQIDRVGVLTCGIDQGLGWLELRRPK